MAAIARQQIDELARSVASLHGSAVRDPGESRMAEAVARLWERFDYQDAPLEILQVLFHAIEIGYATAVQDLRDGEYDDDLLLWRPALFSG